MIEIVNNNLCKKRPKKLRRFFIILLVIVIFILLFLNYKFNVTKTVLDVSKETLYKYSVNSVNETVLESLKNQTSYNEIVNIEKNSNGDIILISADSYKINLISREICSKTERKLNEKIDKGVPIPFFAFSGISLISGYGTKINYNSFNISSIESDILSNFFSVGINQTLHSIYIKIIVKINLNMPFNVESEEFESKILLCESVILGKIPDAYLNGNIFDK